MPTLIRSLILTVPALLFHGGSRAAEPQPAPRPTPGPAAPARPAGPAQTIAAVLEKAEQAAHQPGQGWKKAAMPAAAALKGQDAKAVTAALYARLQAAGPHGVTRALVSRIVQTTQAFAPEVWLTHVEAEPDPFIQAAGMQIFGLTKFKTQPRFHTLLQAALSDTRVGRPLVGEEAAYADQGLRVCDVAYNIWMSGRPDRPPQAPLDVAGDTVATRDALILALCAQLHVPGPPPSARQSAR